MYAFLNSKLENVNDLTPDINPPQEFYTKPYHTIHK